MTSKNEELFDSLSFLNTEISLKFFGMFNIIIIQ